MLLRRVVLVPRSAGYRYDQFWTELVAFLSPLPTNNIQQPKSDWNTCRMKCETNYLQGLYLLRMGHTF